MQQLSHQRYFFGEFTLDLTRGCLLRGEDEVKLRPKSFAVLQYLVENSGRLISKDQLIRVGWAAAAVTDDSLVKCMKDIRQALHDEGQQIIRTVPRRGYIFAADVIENIAVAPVTTVTEEASGVQVIIEEQTNGNRRVAALRTAKSMALQPESKAAGFARFTSVIKQHRWIVAAGLLTLTIITTATVYLTRPGEAIDSIAVLPFVNDSNNAEMEYLSDGISDSLINSLSQLPNLKRVVPFSSVERYKNKQVDPQQVGRELNVRAVLTGRFIQRGEDLLIIVELVDVKNNTRLWGEQYPRKSADILNLHGEIAREISENLRLRLTGEQKQLLAKRYTDNAEAFQLYLQGRYYWKKNTDNSRSGSVEYFQKAIEKDPNYALAWAGLADYYSVMAHFGQMPPTEAWRKSEEAAVRALAIDGALAEAHFSFAAVKMWLDWNWAEAEQETRRAIELNPEIAEFHSQYAWLLNAVGRFDEAIAEAKRSQEVDPLREHYRADVGHILYHARQYDEAIEEIRKNPDSIQTHLGLGEIYVKQGRYEEALAEMVRARPLVKSPRHLARIGSVYAAAGKRNEAIKLLEEVKRQTDERYNLASHIAAIYAELGNKADAFAWLDSAYEAHTFDLIEVKVNPKFDNLRSDPRFTNLLARMHFPP